MELVTVYHNRYVMYKAKSNKLSCIYARSIIWRCFLTVKPFSDVRSRFRQVVANTNSDHKVCDRHNQSGDVQKRSGRHQSYKSDVDLTLIARTTSVLEFRIVRRLVARINGDAS